MRVKRFTAASGWLGRRTWPQTTLPPSVMEFGRAILHDEARALDALADSLGTPFEKAVG